MVLQYEDSTINRSSHFVPVLGVHHITAEGRAEPKLSDGHSTFHVKREMIFTEKTAYTMIHSVFRCHQAESCHFVSQFCPFDYHRVHDVEDSLAKYCNNERDHLYDDRPAA